eukprot:TRINITY_DN1034_c0_g1_i2.p1 TRINITY_DN1034_c0_g1~~TRINITY_DN1034_c0_g1_i2.p1  ORF type:complete len:742 (-),score=253.74 TRINITY_DN1034_c0_g1_i2:2422-4647(-)
MAQSEEGGGCGGSCSSAFMTEWCPVAPTEMEPLEDPIVEESYFSDDDDTDVRSTSTHFFEAGSRSQLSCGSRRMREIIPEQVVKKSVEKKSKSFRDTLRRKRIEEIQSDVIAMEQENMQKKKIHDAEQRRKAFLESREKSVIERRKTAKKVSRNGSESPPLGQWASSSPTSPIRRGRTPSKDVSPDEIDRWVRSSPTRHTVELHEYCEFLRSKERKGPQKKTSKKTESSGKDGSSGDSSLVVEDVEQAEEQDEEKEVDESVEEHLNDEDKQDSDLLLDTIPHELVWKAVRIHERCVKNTYERRQRLIKKQKVKKEEEKMKLLQQRAREQQDRLAELSQRIAHDERKKRIAVQQHLKEHEELAEKKRLELEEKERQMQEKMEKLKLSRENEIQSRREMQRKIDMEFKRKLAAMEEERRKRCEEKEIKVIEQVERAAREAELHKQKADELASIRAQEAQEKRRRLEKVQELQRQKLESKQQRHQERISRLGYQKDMHRKRVEDANRSEILLRHRLEEMAYTAKHFGRYDDEILRQMYEAESTLHDFPSLSKKNPHGERILRSESGMRTRHEKGSIMSFSHSSSSSKIGGRPDTASSSIQKSRKKMCELCKHEFDPEFLRHRVTYRKIVQFREAHGVDGKFNLNKGKRAGTMYDLARVCIFCRHLLQDGFEPEKRASKKIKRKKKKKVKHVEQVEQKSTGRRIETGEKMSSSSTLASAHESSESNGKGKEDQEEHKEQETFETM